AGGAARIAVSISSYARGSVPSTSCKPPRLERSRGDGDSSQTPNPAGSPGPRGAHRRPRCAAMAAIDCTSARAGVATEHSLLALAYRLPARNLERRTPAPLWLSSPLMEGPFDRGNHQGGDHGR